MKQGEMLSKLHLIFSSRYKQVSPPQSYQGQGPYLMTMEETGDSCEFHCYEITDAETFLSAPEQFSPAFYEPEFFVQSYRFGQGERAFYGEKQQYIIFCNLNNMSV